MNARINDVGVAPAYRTTLDDDMRAFDALPGSVRSALQQANLKWGAEGVHRLLFRLRCEGLAHDEAALRVCESILWAEAKEIHKFAATYWPKALGPYPHLAAGASVLR